MMAQHFIKVIFVLLFTCFTLTIANFEIVGTGVVPLRRGDVGMVFYVTVRNTCKQAYHVTINMVKCWETIMGEDPDNNTVKVLGGNMCELQANETRNLSYIFPNLYAYNRAGECQLAVWYGDRVQKRRELRVTVPFDTLLTRHTVPPDLRGFVEMKDVRKCVSLDEDPLDNCTPVNCPAKYSGMRNFFNHRLKKCQPVPECTANPDNDLPDITYSPISNTCQGMEITDEDIRFLIGSDGKCEDQMTSQPIPHIKNIRCHHGKLDPVTGFCVCHNGWGSPPMDPDQFDPSTMLYHMCTIQVRAWSSIYDHQFQTRYIIVSIVAVSIAMIITCCAFCTLNIWQYMLALWAPADLYDWDGYKLYHGRHGNHSSNNSTALDDDGDMTCYCGPNIPEVPPCEYRQINICSKPKSTAVRAAPTRRYKSLQDILEHYPSSVEEGEGVHPKNSGKRATFLVDSDGYETAESDDKSGRRSFRSQRFTSYAPAVLNCEQNVKFRLDSEERVGGPGSKRDKGCALSSIHSST